MLILTATKAVIMLAGIWHVLQCQAHEPSTLSMHCLIQVIAHSLQMLEPPVVGAEGESPRCSIYLLPVKISF